MRTILKFGAVLPIVFSATTAFAHPGHGLGEASHWHASDAWGCGLALAAAAAVVWFIRRS